MTKIPKITDIAKITDPQDTYKGENLAHSRNVFTICFSKFPALWPFQQWSDPPPPACHTQHYSEVRT